MKRDQLFTKLQECLGPRLLTLEASKRSQYSKDKWFVAVEPEAVAFPRSTREVVRVVEAARQFGISVTPRGAGYGYVGGCVPVKGGIVLSLEKLDRILEINPCDFVAVVQPAVKTAELQNAVEAKRLFYPPDPASRADCSIGGNIATNAGGPRCLKYGVTREYILGLEVVLADGSVVRTGSRTHKNKTGFDLTKLFVGSEGLLGIVTEATLKLLPLPPYRACLAAGFASTRDAIDTIHRIFSAGFLPAALEIADAFTLAAAHKRTQSKRLVGCSGHLIVELDGQEKSVRSEIRDLRKLVAEGNPLFAEVGWGPDGCEDIWKLRREFSFSLRDTGLTKLNEDIVVPRSRLEDLFKLGERLQRKYEMPVACFGHAGDGNIHVNLMIDEASADARGRSDRALDELFTQVLKWGGVITGEHGIGLAKKPWWSQALPPRVRQLHCEIKKALDPHGMLNPGKFLEE